MSICNILKSRTPSNPAPSLDSDRVAAYDMKLMDIDIDSLSIPDTEYDARITMPATEFARIVRDLASLGESVRIDVSKEGVRFTCDGEAANANILLRQSEESGPIGKVKQLKTKEEGEPSSSKKVKKEDGDVDMEEEDEDDKPAASEGEEEQASENEDEDDEETGRKRKKKKVCQPNFWRINVDKGSLTQANVKKKPAKKAKKSKKDDSDDDDDDSSGPSGVVIELNSHVSLTFSLKYLVNFAKSTSISNKVQLMLSSEVPLLVRSFILSS